VFSILVKHLEMERGAEVRRETGLNRSRILMTIAIVVLVAVGLAAALGLWTFTHINSPTTNSISLQGVGLCASNCIYPSPYLSATILVNASVPTSTLHLFINGTDEGITATSNTMTNYALLFKATPNNPAMPITSGKAYTIAIVATFQDSSSATASIIVVASSGR
jgi:hypothetical protein